MWVEQIPLELFHMPWYFKFILMVPLVHRRKDIRVRAIERAEIIKDQVEKERRQQQDQNIQTQRNAASTTTTTPGTNNDEIESLLREACRKLGRDEVDVTPFLSKLNQDWYDDNNYHGVSSFSVFIV